MHCVPLNSSFQSVQNPPLPPPFGISEEHGEEGNGGGETGIDEQEFADHDQLKNHIPLLIATDRLHTPMPKAKTGRRLRDSIKRRGEQQQQQRKQKVVQGGTEERA